MRNIIPYFKKYKKEFIFGPTFKFLEVLSELFLPTAMSWIINNGIYANNMNYIIKISLIMLVAAIFGFICAFICQYYAARASQAFATDLRNDIFEKVLSFSFKQTNKFGSSTLINRITNDVNQLQQLVNMTIRLVTRAPFICIGSIIMSFFIDPVMALILLFGTPILGIIIYFITKNISPLYKTYQIKVDRLSQIIGENLSGVRVIRAFIKTKNEAKRFNNQNDDLMHNGFHIGRISALFNPLTTLVINIMILIVIWVGGVQINVGNLSQGQIIALVNYINQILYSLIIISNLIILFTKSFTSATRVSEILVIDTNTQENNLIESYTIDNNHTNNSKNISNNSIQENDNLLDTSLPILEFHNVSFRYNKLDKDVLNNITFKINCGETFGIIGATGSGKSSLVNLIPKFYSITGGSILVNGKDISQYDDKILREKIGFVLQKSILFTGTIKENICWGKENATLEDIQLACKASQAQEFIEELPEKYNFFIQRGGKNLSGGQKQRLTIARALVKNPDILVLDDSSSALDVITDMKLKKSLKELYPSQTVITVSQRISSVIHCDNILVLENGNIAGIGKHTELLETCKIYKEIYISQNPEEVH